MNGTVVDHPAKTRQESLMQRGNGPRLVACSSVIRGKVIGLESAWTLPFVVGANHSCDFMIAGSTMSDFHAAIEFTEGEWLISSVDNNAKLWVNNEPVDVAVMEHGDQVQLGRHLLVFLCNHTEDAVSDALIVAQAKLSAR